MKTFVLLVSGENDYGVIDFQDYNEENNLTLIDWVREVSSYDDLAITIETEDYNFNVELFVFEDVDKKFVDFIKNEIQDYDETKSTDFFVVYENEFDNGIE